MKINGVIEGIELQRLFMDMIKTTQYAFIATYCKA
jgi:hypothetical protein